ncbi:hypothetical protein BH23BAC4_BH23BAC4_02080 [soil metagenome]
MNVRQAGRIVSGAVIVAVGVNSDGRREVLGLEIGPSEAETFWTAFLRKLFRRDLRGVKLVTPIPMKGSRRPYRRCSACPWQRCRVGLLKNFGNERGVALWKQGCGGVVTFVNPERAARPWSSSGARTAAECWHKRT